MINCQFENLRNVVDVNGVKIGEIFETFKCDDDVSRYELQTVDGHDFRIFKNVDAGDLIIFWFAVAITVA